MTIDPEKLEEAIKEFEEVERRWALNSNQKVLLAAARAHLARLPRYKEVEVELWARFDGRRVQGCASDRAEVDENIAKFGGYAVRLTGTAKVKVTP